MANPGGRSSNGRPRRLRGSYFSGLVALVLSLLIGACGGSGSQVGTVIQDPDLVAAGADLYAASCAECHGADLRGTDKGPSHLSEVYEPGHHGDGAFLLAVQRGSRAHHWSFGDMPPIAGLSIDDVESIIAFVREQQRIEGFEPHPP